MQNPIPFDWDGESWRRLCVCWPDSPQWLALLRGFITYATRGRAWDGSTGSIKDIQAIGWQIANNNLPLQEVALSCQEAQELTRAVIVLFHAITGTDWDGTTEQPNSDFLNTVWYWSSDGLANRLGPGVHELHEDTLQATLESLKVSIDELKEALVSSGGTGEDLEDDLAKVWGALDDITTILGGDPSDPPEPL